MIAGDNPPLSLDRIAWAIVVIARAPRRQPARMRKRRGGDICVRNRCLEADDSFAHARLTVVRAAQASASGAGTESSREPAACDLS
jgi:hypothetical protein